MVFSASRNHSFSCKTFIFNALCCANTEALHAVNKQSVNTHSFTICFPLFALQRSNQANSPFKKREGNWAGLASVRLTGEAPVSYWPIFSLSLVTVPDVFANVDLTQLSSRF